MKIRETSFVYVKKNYKEIIRKICDLDKIKPSKKPFTLFMAGSPGSGNNSDKVQRAATLLFDKTFDLIQKKNINAIIDTTFASPKSISNVKRALGRNRNVAIIYLHEDPFRAWEFTKKREKIEGRCVPKDVFINAYFAAQKNVIKVKQKYGKSVELHLFEKDKNFNYKNKAKFNINSLESYLNNNHTRHELEKKLPNKL